MECAAQIERYSALCTSPHVKTAAEYTEYTDGILRHTVIQTGFDIKHEANKQASNLVYATQSQQETALAAATAATNTFWPEYASCKQAICTKEKVS